MKKVLLVYDPESHRLTLIVEVSTIAVSTPWLAMTSMMPKIASYAKYDLVVVDLMDNEEAMAKLIEKFRDSETKVIALATNSFSLPGGYSSVGRASDLHSEGQRFDSAYLHLEQLTIISRSDSPPGKLLLGLCHWYLHQQQCRNLFVQGQFCWQLQR